MVEHGQFGMVRKNTHDQRGAGTALDGPPGFKVPTLPTLPTLLPKPVPETPLSSLLPTL